MKKFLYGLVLSFFLVSIVLGQTIYNYTDKFSVSWTPAPITDCSGNTVQPKDASNHPAVFPEQLVSDHIISWSNEGELVYDPFMGSGTTAKITLLNNRKFVGSEIAKEYCEIAEKRINEVQEFK